MATEPIRIPIRNLTREIENVTADTWLIADDGTAMGKAKAGNAVDTRATSIVNAKIAELSLGTASQSNVEDFATATQGARADSAVQPSDLAAIATSGEADDVTYDPTSSGLSATDMQGAIDELSSWFDERGVVRVANRTALKALDGTKTPVAYLYGEGGRNGTFVWNPGNFSAGVAADPAEAIYVPPASDPTGASGAWVRQNDGELLATWFGAVGDNSTDNTSALQAAINFAAAISWAKRLRIPAGTYRTTTLTIASAMTMTGDGLQRTTLRFSNVSGDCIKIDHGSANITGLTLCDFRVDAVSPKSDGWGVIQTCSDGGALFWFTMENILFSTNLYSGWSLQCAYFTAVNRVSISDIGVGAIGIRIMGASNLRRVVETTLVNCAVNNGMGGNSIGMLIDSFAEGIWLHRVIIEKSNISYGMIIRNSLKATDPVANDSVKHIYGTQVCCDRSGLICLRIEDDVRTVRFSASWFTSALFNHGVYLVGGYDITFDNCDMSNNGQNGVRIAAAATDVTLNACGVIANSVRSGEIGMHSGVRVEADARNFTINACRFYRKPGSTKSQKHAVEIIGGTSTNYIVTSNCDGGSLDPVSYYDGGSGANKLVVNNL